MARNLTFENSLPDKNSPGVAVRSSADRVIFDNVRVLGYQDTLFLDEMSRQYLRDSFVTGDVDFIFGDATAVFDHCTIESTDFGFITAADTDRTTANGFVFLDCSLVAGRDRNPSVDDNTVGHAPVFMGRPWMWWDSQKMPSVIFIRAKMGSHITSAGWDPWNDPGVPGANSSRRAAGGGARQRSPRGGASLRPARVHRVRHLLVRLPQPPAAAGRHSHGPRAMGVGVAKQRDRENNREA